jgi:membrane protease subunit (stomatin/prohibitin family)
MRGRWASAAIGAGIARNRAGREMEAQEAAHQREMDQMRQQYEQQAQQQAQSRPQQSSGQEDVTQKLQKLADLKKQGILSEEEFQKMKTDLLAKL